jgi:hypothetical protein
MTGTQLKALRKLFMISISAAARFVGYVELATWHRWEKGASKVPDYVAEEMLSINDARQKHISQIIFGLNTQETDYSLESLAKAVEMLADHKPDINKNVLAFDSVIAGVYAAILEKQEDIKP